MEGHCSPTVSPVVAVCEKRVNDPAQARRKNRNDRIYYFFKDWIFAGKSSPRRFLAIIIPFPSISTLLGIVFTLIEVTLQSYLWFDEYNYGVFTGGSLHEIAHAVAAGGAGGQVALDAAILTKLSRVLMLIVVAGVLIVVNKNTHKDKT